jgi:hypothetical protein
MELTPEVVETLIQTRDAGRSKAAAKMLLKPRIAEFILDFRDSQIEDMGQFGSYAHHINKFRGWDLSQNYIREIPEDFGEHSKLSTFMISENILTRMNGFDQNMYIQVLDLNNNQIAKIEGLNNVPELRVLVAQS